MKNKLWIIGYFFIVITLLVIIASKTITVDPYFHFHAPNTKDYYYDISNPRSQNDGILKHFDYEGIIIGTSMVQNFRTSEAEDIFDVKFVKVPYPGASYKEINAALTIAASHNPKLKYIIRGLDMEMFLHDKEKMRYELGKYPTYLYDDNLFNDIEYLCNREVFFSRVYPMILAKEKPYSQGKGITTFDEYSNWMKRYKFGHKTLFPKGLTVKKPAAPILLSPQNMDTIKGNIQQNVTKLAEKYPNITFYYFFTPYSAAWWRSLRDKGRLEQQINAEKIIIEEILKFGNIKLFSFNTLFHITTDLNYYKDYTHYGEWVNSLILHDIYDGKGQLTWDNYLDYLEEERLFYANYDYTQLTNQEDYVNDSYAVALLREAITGIKPHSINLKTDDSLKLSHATIKEDQYRGESGIVCTGRLKRSTSENIPLSYFLQQVEYIGAKIQLPDLAPYKYLIFYGKKIANQGQPTVRLYDESGKSIISYNKSYHELDNEWHRYILDISKVNGRCTLILNGGYIDNTGSPDSTYVFSNITLY